MKKTIFTLLLASSAFIGFGQNKKTHLVEPNETFYSIARLYNISPIDLMKTNPSYGPTFSLKINDKIEVEKERNQDNIGKQKKGKGVIFEMSDLPQKENVTNVHLAKEGQTLANISNLYKISISRLMRANNISYAMQKLSEGAMVFVPENLVETTNYHEAVIAENKPIYNTTLIPASYFKVNNNEVTAAKSNSEDKSFLKLVEHQVQKKETLLEIGNRYGILITKIMELNKMQTVKLRPGQRIFINAEWIHPHTADAKSNNTNTIDL